MNEQTLPNAESAILDLRKIDEYLLNPEHEDGKSKSRFFTSFGFTRSDSEVLRSSLLTHAATMPVIQIKDSEYGKKYVMECNCVSPDGRNPCIRSVWIIEEELPNPRFVTAVPTDLR